MKLRTTELSEQVKLVDYREPADALNELIDQSPRFGEQYFRDTVSVTAEFYRYGTDVHVTGRLTGDLACTCVRCLDEFYRPVTRDFKFLLVKSDKEPELEPDAGLDRYQGEEIDLGALAREQALLALEPKSLCSEDCKGLCSGCGASLNSEPCRC